MVVCQSYIAWSRRRVTVDSTQGAGKFECNLAGSKTLPRSKTIVGLTEFPLLFRLALTSLLESSQRIDTPLCRHVSGVLWQQVDVVDLREVG